MRLPSLPRLVLALGGVLTVAYMAVVFITSREEPADGGFDDRPVATGGQTSVIYNFHHAESQLDKTSWELSAARAELTGDRARLENIRMIIYSRQGKSITIEGREGELDIETRNARILGEITAVYGDGYRFATDEMRWDAERKVVTSTGPVLITGPEGEIRGGILEGSPETEEYILRGGVMVELRDLGGAPADGKAEGPR